MKNKLLKLISIIVALLVFYQFPLTVKADTVMKNSISEVNLENFKKEKKNLLYSELDKSGRPYRSYFIGNDKYQEGKRVGKPEEPQNLKGKWYQQNLAPKGEKPIYLWDRGHLVGNQFAGHPSNLGINIVGQTSYANQKLQTYFEGGMKTSNKNALDNWLYLHPNYVIEYFVTANYKNDTDQYPVSNTLKFRGVDMKGNTIKIKLPDSDQEGIDKQVDEDADFTSVTIHNIYPGWDIDYKTGVATKKGEDSKGKKSSVEEVKTSQNGSDDLASGIVPEEFEQAKDFFSWLIDIIVRIFRSNR
jgi:streptodornase